MGRREKPIASSDNEALFGLAQWLRDQRLASGCSYAELAARVGCHATTLQRAASGRSVPSEQSVRAYAKACGAPVDEAVKLWRQARSRRSAEGSPDPLDIDGIDMFQAGLRELYEMAGRPSMHHMEKRAGPGQLPHSTAHRIVHGRTMPRDVHQLTGFLAACSVAEEERQLWIDVWERARQRGSLSPGPQPVEVPGPAMPTSGLYVSVLGPVRAWSDGQPVDVGSFKQQAVLAALLLRKGQITSTEQLIDGIWGDHPPASGSAALRPYASRIRKALGPGVLISKSGGYTIQLPDGALDVTRAHDLCTRAERARAQGDLRGAQALLQHALDLWEGPALAGLTGPYAATERIRLEEHRLRILQACLEMDLMLGRHAEAVPELTALAASQPYNERLCALLMLALYRSHRTADALSVYVAIRTKLRDELGVDPERELTETYLSVLRGDPELDFNGSRALGRTPQSGLTTRLW